MYGHILKEFSLDEGHVTKSSESPLTFNPYDKMVNLMSKQLFEEANRNFVIGQRASCPK